MTTNAKAEGFDLNRPTIVALLILAGAMTAVPTLIGAVLAYLWRGNPENAAWEESHYAYHIKGFWMTIVVAIIFGVLTIASFFLLAPLFGLITVWLAVRGVVATVKAQRREPMPNPGSLLW